VTEERIRKENEQGSRDYTVNVNGVRENGHGSQIRRGISGGLQKLCGQRILAFYFCLSLDFSLLSTPQNHPGLGSFLFLSFFFHKPISRREYPYRDTLGGRPKRY
jgi:hypothetical protein